MDVDRRNDRNVIAHLNAYKLEKEYSGIDFEADLVQFYTDIKYMLAETYPPNYFGARSIP